MDNAKAPARHSFSRVGKLLTIFGFGASSPYNSLTVSRRRSDLPPGGSSGAGGLGNFSDWYHRQLEDGRDFNSQLGDWKDMVSYSPIAGAIRIIVEECIQTEHSCPGTLWVEGADTDTEAELNHLINVVLGVDDVIRSQFWWVVAYGNNFEKLVIGPKGVHGWRKVDLDQIERVVDEHRRLVGFYYKEEDPPDGTCALWGSAGSQKKLWKPWDFIHFRLTSEDRSSEYGTSLLRPATQVYKKLRMAEDQMTTYRLQMQPSRYVFMVDVGENPVTDVSLITNEWNNYLRSSQRIDPNNNTYDNRYNPWAMDDLIIIPRRKDSGSSFDKISGDTEVPDITDVKYLLRQLAGAINVPAEFIGVEPEGGSSLNSKSPLAVQDMRFLRSIKSVRAPVMKAYDMVCRIHLALNNRDPFVPFKIKMSNISALESESQMELVSAQADMADKLIALGNNIDAPKDEWLRMIFTKFMPLPAELVDIISIGHSVDGGGSGSYEPVPSGPDLDMGSGSDSGSSDNSMPFSPENSPIEMPTPLTGEESVDISKVKNYMAERRKACQRRNARYFSLKESARRYRRCYQLNESVMNESKLTETRRILSEKLEDIRNHLSAHPKLWHSIGRIVSVTEGYFPEIYRFSESDYRTWLEDLQVNGNKRRLCESKPSTRLTEDTQVTDKHEFQVVVESARASSSKTA